jgi:TrmH family RNA methyltransferase
MAVGAEDILEKAEVYGSLKEALLGADYVVGTSGRVRVASVLPPRDAAGKIVEAVGRGKRVLLLFGSERNGLRKEELALCDLRIRIPMAGSEPTYNLAQAAMIVLYECLVSVI